MTTQSFLQISLFSKITLIKHLVIKYVFTQRQNLALLPVYFQFL